MMRYVLAAVVAVSAVAISAASPADAGGFSRYSRGDGGAHPKSEYYRSKYRGTPQVRGYVKRRGGYSYTKADSINTYGDAHGRFGSNKAFRDPALESQQTISGPFDSGFFFNTPKGAFGADAPYMN